MNLTLDHERPLFFRYLLPALGSAAVVSVYAFVDTIAVGQGVGYQGTAALAVVTPLFQVAAFFGILCGMGASVRISIAQGTLNRKLELQAFKASALMLGFFSVIVTGLFWFFRDFIFDLLGSSPSISSFVHGYGDLLILIFPLMMFCSWCPFICRSDHDPNLPLYSTLIGGAFNIFGDWFFVFPLKMGIFGAILATSLGYVVQVLVLAVHFISKKNTFTLRKVNFHFQEAFKVLECGFGTAFLEAAMVVATILMNNQIQHYMDESALALFGVLLTISSLFSHMFMGIGQAASPLISVNFGAKQPKRILKFIRYSLMTTILFSVLFFLSGWCFPDEITVLFVRPTPEIMAISKPVMQMYFISFLFLGINTVAVYILQSVEKNTLAAMLTLFRGVIVIAVLLFTLPNLLGSDGIWYSVILNDLLVAIGSCLCLYRIWRQFEIMKKISD